MDYREFLKEKYANSSELDRDDLLMLQDICNSLDGWCEEKDLIDWLKKNPSASYQDMLHYVFKDYTPIEIVDDDELDEEDE